LRSRKHFVPTSDSVTEEGSISAPVTVVVIAFNEERRISPCLEALLDQDVTSPYNVIVVDDGSRDSTPQIVEQLQRDFGNLKLVRHEVNRGRGAARRSGQDAADSLWIGFVDADIVVPRDWLRRCLDALADADAVSGIAQPDGDCAVVWRICSPTLRRRAGSAEITGNNVLFYRDALTRVPFSEVAKLGEDFRLAKLMAKSGLRLRTIDELTVEHRESKSYGNGVLWMWQSGVDATALLFEFRVIRVPDLAWLTWLLGSAVAFIVAGVGVTMYWQSALIVVALALIVNALFINSRFSPLPHPLRFLSALTISPPLMFAYLMGRTAGLVRFGRLKRQGHA
jgi:glycosyltransferase involved in cell wall biosynthesis